MSTDAEESAARLMWTPPVEAGVPLREFMRRVEAKYGVTFDGSYSALHAWSCASYPEFWAEVWDFCGVQASVPYSRVVDPRLRIDEFPPWFPSARLNYAENLLSRPRPDAAVAVHFAGIGPRLCPLRELGRAAAAAYELEVGALASALRASGIVAGDAVAGFAPNSPETLAAFLATAAVGAVWTAASPDFGVTGVVERFGQVKPRLLFAAAAVAYNGRRHDSRPKLREMAKHLPSLETVVILPFLELGDVYAEDSSENDDEWLSFDEFLGRGSEEPLQFEQVPSSHPLCIMFSSGTTGAPKCLVHSVGGTLIKHLAEHRLQGCLGPEDVILFYTTAGWMMWNWLVSALGVGATLVLYDGSPFLPSPSVLFDLVDKLGITALGMGAKVVEVLRQKGLKPRATHSLASLHTLYTTGSPLSPACFDYVYADVKADLLLSSISGGTDIIGCFMGGNWVSPLHRGQIQGPFLGCAVEAWSGGGSAVLDQRGDLVCLKPIPSAPVRFLNDPERARYKAAYFAHFPGVWAHGDFLRVDGRTGGLEMLGRSDGTLNPGGVRFGSSEIYTIVEEWAHAKSPPPVTDAVCVGQSTGGGEERVVLFLRMADGVALTEATVAELKATIRVRLSARHVPALILPVPDVPYTHSGKKVELAVRSTIAGEDVANAAALRNPEALAHFRHIPELRL